MADEKDRYGDKMRLVEKAKEDIYFAQRDRELLDRLRGHLKKAEGVGAVNCPKCPGKLEGYTFEGFTLDRCHECGGIWMDKGELEGILRKMSRGPLGAWVDVMTATTKK